MLIIILSCMFIGGVARVLHGTDLTSRPIAAGILTLPLFAFIPWELTCVLFLSVWYAMTYGHGRYFMTITGYDPHPGETEVWPIDQIVTFLLGKPGKDLRQTLNWGKLAFSIKGAWELSVAASPLLVYSPSLWYLLVPLCGSMQGLAYNYQRSYYLEKGWGEGDKVLRLPEWIVGGLYGFVISGYYLGVYNV